MFSVVEILISATVALLAYCYIRKNRNESDEKPIPAPFTLPIFGHMFFLGLRSYYKITEWSKTYGSIYKLKLGAIESVVISDPVLIREAFNLPVFSGRADLKSFTLMADGKNGIVSSDGPVWTEQRRFAIRHLRDFGFGRKSTENMIMEEVNETIDGFRKNVGKPVLVQKQFSLAVLNSLWQMITGYRYSHDDPKLLDLLTRANEAFAEASVNPIVAFFPSIAELFPKITGWQSFQDTCTSLREFFREQVNEHRKTLEKDNPRDLIDTYLVEIDKTKEQNSSFYKDMGEKQLIATIGDMFSAGSDTTSSTLQWAVLYLSQNQNVQDKFRTEIENSVGKSKVPSVEDRQNMPYAEALIMEILRKSSIVPIGVMHFMMADAEFHGYKIPKGYGILPNLYGVHNDPAIWTDPQNFRPERFIDENGQCVKKHDCLMPFSIGKRACIGESLARDTLFLFLTSIFQQFKVVPDPATKVTLETKIGFILQPQPFKVIFQEL